MATPIKPASAADSPTAIVVGASARACAMSLLKVGVTPVCVDLFADRDLARIARVLQCPMQEYPDGLARLVLGGLADVDPSAMVVTTGALENHAAVLGEIEKKRRLFTGPAEAVAQARKPGFLFRACKQVDSPLIVGLPELAWPCDPAAMSAASGRWCFKPERSASGHGIVVFDPGRGVPPGIADRVGRLQPWVESGADSAFSAQFFMPDFSAQPSHTNQQAKPGCRLLGCTRQIIGDPHFGARNATQYVGNISTGLLWPGFARAHTQAQAQAQAQAIIDTLEKLGQAICDCAGLSGVFGVDMMLDEQGRLYPIEINPRYTAGMEVVEKATGTPTFAQAFLRPDNQPGKGPGTPIQIAEGPAFGKAVVYAKADCIVPDLYLHFSKAQIADVPQIGERVPAGRPICTVLFEGADEQFCLAGLRSLASRVYTLCQP